MAHNLWTILNWVRRHDDRRPNTVPCALWAVLPSESRTTLYMLPISQNYSNNSSALLSNFYFL